MICETLTNNDIFGLSFDVFTPKVHLISDSSGKRSAIFRTTVWLQLITSRLLFHAFLALRIPSLFEVMSSRGTSSMLSILEDTTHEQTIICTQSFAGHIVGSRLIEGKKLRRMIIIVQLVKIDCRSRITKLGDCLYVRLITKR